jgi:putative tryptophan/tyrosine transport system substrate-binding protein
LTGVLTLLRHLISSRAGFVGEPVLWSVTRKQIRQMLVALCLCFPIAQLHAAPLAVTVLLSESSGVYLEFSDALREKLLNKNVYLDVVDDPDEVNPGQGLVIAVGMKAATAIAGSSAHAILNALVPRAGYEKLLHDFPLRAASKTYSAIFLDQPAERQVRLIAALLPGKRNVGILLDSIPPDELTLLRQRMGVHKLNLHEHRIGPDFPLQVALQHVLDSSDVLLAVPDAAIYNSSTIRNILLASYHSGDPVIGLSPGYVKAGALAAVFSTPAQIAAQTAMAVQRYGETRMLPAAQHPQQFEVSVNEQVGRSLGLTIKSAEELHQEISAIMGDEP